MKKAFITAVIIAAISMKICCNGQSKKYKKREMNNPDNPVLLKAFTPNLMVKDINQTITYYTNILGFEVIQSAPERGVLQWAYLKKGNAKLMFQSAASLKKEFKELEGFENGGALTFFLQVSDTKQWYDAIKDKVKIIKPYGVTPYNGANEFVIMDINGFILHVSDISF